ncbi:uncharacterized protein LOC143174895 [Nomia melanderi]|uniref:uncharacterized protein LOC143174895 n=1 Tax=Nomia melanderi TaxID=2448451 RepID=UPI003FCEA3E4
MTELVNPSTEYNRRAAIIKSLCAGRTPIEIIKFFAYPRSTVYDVAKRYAASEGFEKGSPSSARKMQVKEKSRTPEIIQRIQDMILEDPETSLRKLASVLGVSETIVRRITQEDLRYTSYILKVRQMLSEAAKLKRLACCNLLLCSLKHEAASRIRFFLARKFSLWMPKRTGGTTVGLLTDPRMFLLSSQETVTKEVYLEILKTVVKPWMETMASGRPYLFQQDGALAHTSHLVKNWLSDNVDMFWSKDFWPPNSPDLNPLDYYVWGVIERHGNKCRHSNVNSL